MSKEIYGRVKRLYKGYRQENADLQRYHFVTSIMKPF